MVIPVVSRLRRILVKPFFFKISIISLPCGKAAYESVATGKVVADFNVVGAEGKPVLDADGKPVYSSNMITLDFLGESIEKVLGVEKEPIDGVTQFGSPSTTKGYFQDGRQIGRASCRERV